MPPLAIAAGVGAGSSLLGGILGSSAANRAAQAQQQAASNARQRIDQATQGSQGLQRLIYQRAGQNLAPYQAAGRQALGQLQNLNFQAPTGVTEQNDPGYQFRLKMGQQALQNSAAARGGLLTGGTATALNDYAQGSASQEYGNVFNRALQTYGANYGRLAGLTGLGFDATGEMNRAGSDYAHLYTNTGMEGAFGAGQQYNNQGAAQAGGYINSANAWGGALSGIGNSIGGALMLNSLGGQGGGSPYFGGMSPGQISGAYGGPTQVPTYGSEMPGQIPYPQNGSSYGGAR